ncbi:MAG: hypothetical protein ACI4X9_01340 [Kiritimatiellia bacterium]
MLRESLIICAVTGSFALAAVESVNDLMAERSRLFQQTRQLERELRSAVHDPDNTSPEIEALRAEGARLEKRLKEIREAIGDKVSKLPRVAEKRRLVLENKRQIERLDKAIRQASPPKTQESK